MPVVVITGVGQRLGLCLADYFLDKQYKVIGTYRTERSSIEALRSKGAELYQVDFYQQQQTQQFINSVISDHDAIDCLIHNASDWHDDKDDLDFSDYHQIFSNMMTIHAEVPYQLNLAFKPLLTTNQSSSSNDSASSTDSSNSAKQYSDIIHISDYVAFKGSKKHVAYAASKAALENLTLSFAQRYAPHIKVNSIAPALLAFNEHDDDNYKTKARNKSLLQTEGSFAEAINTVEWLMNSRYITGRTIHLDGGRHLKS